MTEGQAAVQSPAGEAAPQGTSISNGGEVQIPDTSSLQPNERVSKALEYISALEAQEAKEGTEEPAEQPHEMTESEVEEQAKADAKESSEETESVTKEAPEKKQSATEKLMARLSAAKQKREIEERNKSASQETDSLKKEVESLRAQLSSILTNPSEALLKMGKDPVAFVDRIANFKPETPEEKAIRERREYDESLQREISELKKQLGDVLQVNKSSQDDAIRRQVLNKAAATKEDGTFAFPYLYSEFSPDHVYSRAVELAKEVQLMNNDRVAKGEEPIILDDEAFLQHIDGEAKKQYLDRENRRKKAFKLASNEEEESEVEESRVGRSEKKARTNITSANAGQRSVAKKLSPEERMKEAERFLSSQGFR